MVRHRGAATGPLIDPRGKSTATGEDPRGPPTAQSGPGIRGRPDAEDSKTDRARPSSRTVEGPPVLAIARRVPRVRPRDQEVDSQRGRAGRRTGGDNAPNAHPTALAVKRRHPEDGQGTRHRPLAITVEMRGRRSRRYPGRAGCLQPTTRMARLLTGANAVRPHDHQREAQVSLTAPVPHARARGRHARNALRQVALHDRRADSDPQLAGHNVALHQEKEEDLPRSVAERFVVPLALGNDDVRAVEALSRLV